MLGRATSALILSLLNGTLAWAQQTIPVNIFTHDGVPVPALTTANFEGSYKGKAVRIGSIDIAPAPPRIVLLLDVGGSMLGNNTDTDWNFSVEVANVLLVKMPSTTEIGFATFSTDLGHVMAPTKDRQKLVDELETVRKSRRDFAKQDRPDTTVWDAVISGAKMLDPPQAGDAVYVITDAIDNNSKANPGNVVQALACRGIRMFSFTLGDRHSEGDSAGLSELPVLPGRMRSPRPGNIPRDRTPQSLAGQASLEEIAHDTGGLAVTAPRPSETNNRWDFVDKSGNPTELTSSLFAQYRLMLGVYRMSIALPEHVDEPRAWHLNFVRLSGSAKNNLELLYPQKIISCGSAP